MPTDVPQPALAAWAWPRRGPAAADKAALIAREDVLRRVGEALAQRGVSALLVKGAGMTHLYPSPWLRPMSDLDLLVRDRDLDDALAAMRRAGFQLVSDDRPLTRRKLEVGLRAPDGTLVELHTSLDKVAQRAIDLDAVFQRARPAPYPSLFLPGLEDQFLLVVLHLGADELAHATGIVDLEVLLRAGVDMKTVVARASEWQCRTLLFITLQTFDVVSGGTLLDARWLETLEPTGLRRRLLDTHFNVGSWPVAKRPTRLGVPWMYGQSVMHDRPLAFIAGVGSYMVARLRERVIAR